MTGISFVLRRKARIATAFAVGTILLVPLPAFAKGGVETFVVILQNASVVMTSASRCITFTYDKNGNRQAQTTTAPPASSPTWGSSSYGCFAWQH